MKTPEVPWQVSLPEKYNSTFRCIATSVLRCNPAVSCQAGVPYTVPHVYFYLGLPDSVVVSCFGTEAEANLAFRPSYIASDPGIPALVAAPKSL